MSAPRPLPRAVSGELLDLQSSGPTLRGYIAGSGPPLLLVHSVNAAAAAAEVRPLHEHYRAIRTVLSVDLPGFGASDRSDRAYDPRLMSDAVLAAAAQLSARTGNAPVDALAVSLSCEFLARAANQRPAAFRRIALVSPTGLRGGAFRDGPPGSVVGARWILRLLRGPGWGRPLFRGLTRPAVIRYFLERTWGSKSIDETLWRYAIETTRQPGAEHAPLHFLAARLFSRDARTLYQSLTQPVWMSHGIRGDFTDYRGKQCVADRPTWSFDVFPTGALPYFEVPTEFFARFDAFLGSPR
ncbi:MAG: alpha/beta hydrolase [Steroidobacteraceae bacterium]